LFLCISFFSCGSQKEGYEDGSSGRDKISFASDEYVEGHNEGKKDTYFKEQGYNDARTGNAPNPNMEHQLMYRKGYRDAGGLLH
jgi:hypothetical protein